MEKYVKEYKFAKSSQTKSTSSVVVQVLKKNKNNLCNQVDPLFF